MKTRIAICVLMVLLLSGCGDSTPVRQEPVTVISHSPIRESGSELGQSTDASVAHQNAPKIDFKEWDGEITENDFKKGLNEVYVLSRLCMAEAESEGLFGKDAVVRVALNRVESPEFPDSVEGVIYQSEQFTSIWDGRYDSVEPDDECWLAVEIVLEGWTCPAVDEALYFSTPESSGWHRAHLKYTGTLGGHEFFK